MSVPSNCGDAAPMGHVSMRSSWRLRLFAGRWVGCRIDHIGFMVLEIWPFV